LMAITSSFSSKDSLPGRRTLDCLAKLLRHRLRTVTRFPRASASALTGRDTCNRRVNTTFFTPAALARSATILRSLCAAMLPHLQILFRFAVQRTGGNQRLRNGRRSLARKCAQRTYTHRRGRPACLDLVRTRAWTRWRCKSRDSLRTRVDATVSSPQNRGANRPTLLMPAQAGPTISMQRRPSLPLAGLLLQPLTVMRTPFCLYGSADAASACPRQPGQPGPCPRRSRRCASASQRRPEYLPESEIQSGATCRARRKPICPSTRRDSRRHDVELFLKRRSRRERRWQPAAREA